MVSYGFAVDGYWSVIVVFKAVSHRSVFAISFVFVVINGSSEIYMVKYHDGEGLVYMRAVS